MWAMMQKFRTRCGSVGTVAIVGGATIAPWQDLRVAIVMGLGMLLVVAGWVLDANRKLVINRITSRSLGSLAPGYAATPAGLKVYTLLVSFTGMALIGIGIASWSARYGGLLTAIAALGFVVFSIIAIVGEVRTYRALKR